MLRDLFEKQMEYRGQDAADGEGFFDAAQNARLVASAERYYRVMYYGAAESWNLRDRHMFETLEHLLDVARRRASSKAIVWAHNSHVGNAAATDMGLVRGEINIGQLCRERFGDAAVLDRLRHRPRHGRGGLRLGRADGDQAGSPRAPRQLRAALPRQRRRPVPGRPAGGTLARAAQRTAYPRLERAIGVIYRPETELASHYFDASLPQQFDAYLWFDETRAVTPLPTEQRAGVPETYPFGL